MYEKLPEEVKNRGLFCLWKYEKRNGRLTKVPYQITGARASASERKTFTDFDSVLKAYRSGGYDGIGLGIFDEFCAVDIDHCITDGKLSEMAEDIIAIMDSYTETSPSGTGIRILFKATGLTYSNEEYYTNNREIGLEVYNAGKTSKYVTVTGNAIRESEIADRSTEIMSVLEKYNRKPVNAKAEASVTGTAPGSYLSDDEVIAKASASKQGEKFKRLWNGEIPDGKSWSEADVALDCILAFWCGGDKEQMMRMHRKSGLMRDKWEREDYRNSTINKALEITTEFYRPAIADPADDFNEVLTAVKELDPVNNRRYRSGDIGFGRLYADIFKDIARYVPERKSWFCYADGKWSRDTGGLKAMELCKDLADAMLRYALCIKDENQRTEYLKQCMNWQQRRFRETYLKEAQSVYPVPMSAFDNDRYLLNCRNGTLELKTKVFREHRPEDLLTKISPVDYDPAAVCPRFNSFIDEVMSGDKERAKFLQKALGYGIGGSTRYECMFFLYGELTRNGKGTLMESTLRVTGDYGLAVRPETIAQKNNVNSQGPSEDIARLAGIRFANISEPSRGLVLNAAQVKSMTGNDTLNARFLNENSFDFSPQFKLYVNTNFLPVISDMTLFASNRIIIIPFDRHFEEWEQDRSLKEEFARPENQSAILNWLVEGYWLLQEEGLRPPQSVKEATQAYSHESDKVAQFADEWLIEDSTFEMRTAAIYEKYRQWCYDNGCYAENNRNFLHELRKFGTVVRRRPLSGGEKTTLLVGYRLRNHVEPLL